MRHNPSITLRSPWRWSWSGALVGALVGLVWFAPARWLADAVGQASNQHMVLANARGTVWQGSAQLVLSGGMGSSDAVVLPGAVQWQLRPGWGHLAAQLSAECCTTGALQLAASPLGWGGVHVTLGDSESHWPAGLLTGLGTPWNTVQPLGQLEITSKALGIEWAQGRTSLSGSLQLDATDISSRLSTLQPMGSYRVTLQGGPTTSLQLQTLDGSLRLSGTGQWVGRGLHFDGEASAAENRVEALSNLLNILGRRDGARSIIKVG